MKTLFTGAGFFLCFAFTSPFMQDGSVDPDTSLIEERQQKARENIKQRQKATEVLADEKRQQQEQERTEDPAYIDPAIDPELDFRKKEGSLD
jgi:hypothetical protein